MHPVTVQTLLPAAILWSVPGSIDARRHTLLALTVNRALEMNRMFGTALFAKSRRRLTVSLVALLLPAIPALAQDAAQQEQLFQQMVAQPTNYDVTFEFVRVATARGDFEAAIGALERLLYYQPKLTRVKYELGALYFRLRSYEMARHYFSEALKAPDLDPITRERIETYLPDAEKQLQPSRFSGYFQTGLRYQDNANFSPGGAIQVGGQSLALLPIATQMHDWNVYGVAGLSHDYDFQNQRGDIFETRFTGYATHQFKLTDLDVALFDISAGPRLALFPELVQGWAVKPYAVGGRAWVGGRGYLATVGAGIALIAPITDRFSLSPGFEWRRADVTSGGIATGFGSADWYTGSVAATFLLTNTVKTEGKALYRRGEAALPWQSFNQWAGEAAITFEFAPPFPMISRNWSVTPFVRLIRTELDAPNPVVDPNIAELDREWIAGAVFNTPLWRNIAFTTTVQYDKTASSLPNFSQRNFSVMAGPSARF